MKIGKPFNFAATNAPLPSLTISERIGEGKTVFSLGEKTSISKESYPCPSLYIGLSGRGALLKEGEVSFSQGECYLAKAEECLGKQAKEGLVYLEWLLEGNTKMNELLNKGKVFALKDALPYQEGKIVNLTLMENAKSQLAVIAMRRALSSLPTKRLGKPCC